MRRVNTKTFSGSEWKSNSKKILDGMKQDTTFDTLIQSHDIPSNSKTHILTPEETRLLDQSINHFYVTDLDMPECQRYWRTNPERSREVLLSLRERGIIETMYWTSLNLIPNVVIFSQGSEARVCALTDSLLTESITSYVEVFDGGQRSIAICRFDHDTRMNLLAQLPAEAEKVGLQVSCNRATNHRNYRTTLLSRLLSDDGTWDDDISGIISQSRLKS